MRRIRPRTPWTVEAVRLVHREQRLRALRHDALLAKRLRGGTERAPAPGGAVIRCKYGARLRFVHLDALLADRGRWTSSHGDVAPKTNCVFFERCTSFHT